MVDGAGMDRKADEKIQFSTSKEVTVHPTFEPMSLKGASHPSDASHVVAMRLHE
jgi:hypothetical protein